MQQNNRDSGNAAAPLPGGKLVTVEIEDRIAWVAINRPNWGIILKGMKQFLDEKTYKPGLGAYKREG